MAKKDEFRVSKRGEMTALKIELAGEAIYKENKRRKKFNKTKAVVNGKVEALDMLRPSFAPTRHHRRFHVRLSNKFLCGSLSALCDVMRGAGITYPWRVQEA